METLVEVEGETLSDEFVGTLNEPRTRLEDEELSFPLLELKSSSSS